MDSSELIKQKQAELEKEKNALLQNHSMMEEVSHQTFIIINST